MASLLSLIYLFKFLVSELFGWSLDSNNSTLILFESRSVESRTFACFSINWTKKCFLGDNTIQNFKYGELFLLKAVSNCLAKFSDLRADSPLFAYAHLEIE